ncbi:hypothetical protein JW835_08890 [bacterium]|nr:hypothetical protein [bacterium]
MKKWIAILLILCIGASMILMTGCEKQQVEDEAEAVSAPADTVAAAADTAAVEAMDVEEAAE